MNITVSQKKSNLLRQVLPTFITVRNLLGQVFASGKEGTITIQQLQALSFLKQNSHVSIKELAQHITMSPSAVTHFTDRLVTAGLITRKHDSQDRRVVRLAITPTGEERLQVLQKGRLEKMRTIFGALSQEDLQDLLRIHQNLISILEAERGKRTT